jgi:hypothetical protein
MSNQTWGALDAGEGELLRRDIGGVTLWVRASEDEWQIAHVYADAQDLADGEGAQDDLSELKWTRFVTVKDDKVFTQPALPDRPVIVRPQAPIVILPGRWGRFYFSVPLFARFVSQPQGKQVPMVEIPTRLLSSTWFGDMVTGELCYTMDSRLLRTVPETDADDAYARCEMEIRNGSKERLEFQRLCVHVEHMHLYGAGGKFWSNQVRVVFKGSEQVSQISYLPGPPDTVTDAMVVCDPRQALDRNIFKRSFNLIREMTGI